MLGDDVSSWTLQQSTPNSKKRNRNISPSNYVTFLCVGTFLRLLLLLLCNFNFSEVHFKRVVQESSFFRKGKFKGIRYPKEKLLHSSLLKILAKLESICVDCSISFTRKKNSVYSLYFDAIPIEFQPCCNSLQRTSIGLSKGSLSLLLQQYTKHNALIG